VSEGVISSAEAPTVVDPEAALDDDFFHSELRLRHIGRRRHADQEVDEEELFDAAATVGVRRSE